MDEGETQLQGCLRLVRRSRQTRRLGRLTGHVLRLLLPHLEQAFSKPTAGGRFAPRERALATVFARAL